MKILILTTVSVFALLVIRGYISFLCDRRTNVKLSCVGDDFKIFLFVYTRKMDDGISKVHRKYFIVAA